MTGIHRAVLPAVGNKERKNNPVPRPPRTNVSINPFPIFAYPDITISLVSAGIIFAVYSTITSTVSSAYSEAYPWLSETILGVAYLPTGVGMLIGSMLFGRVLDWDYRRIKKRIGDEKVQSGEFPKEYARLRLMPAHVVIFVIASMGWGWAIQTRVSMAVPLVMQSLREFPASHVHDSVVLNLGVLIYI
jgi:MFS family permease